MKNKNKKVGGGWETIIDTSNFPSKSRLGKGVLLSLLLSIN